LRYAGKIVGTLVGAGYSYFRNAAWMDPDPVWLFMIPGGLFGFVVGAIYDKKLEERIRMFGWEESRDDKAWWKWWKSEFDKTKWKSIDNQTTKSQQEEPSPADDAFNRALAVLAAGIAQADGEITDRETSRVRKFFIERFDCQGAEEWVKIFEFQAMQNVNVSSYCASLEKKLGYASRLHLFGILNSIAAADGKINAEAKRILDNIAAGLKIAFSDRGPAEFTTAIPFDSPYAVLGLRRGASRAEVKRSFHRLALQYHPDKVAHLGEKYVKEAEARFRKIKEAYDEIQG